MATTFIMNALKNATQNMVQKMVMGASLAHIGEPRHEPL